MEREKERRKQKAPKRTVGDGGEYELRQIGGPLAGCTCLPKQVLTRVWNRARKAAPVGAK